MAQIAKHAGAAVTEVCSKKKVEPAHSLGADYVLDCKKKDSIPRVNNTT
jgi:NADPH:quinone reductase-like Zn-dependent oxidoreductase